MIKEIKLFIDDSYHEDIVTNITDAFSLFELFDVYDIDTPFLDLILSYDGKDPMYVKDTFIELIHDKLDDLLKQHTIILNEDANLEIKNTFLLALYRIANLDDYSLYIPRFEVNENPYEIIKDIIVDNCLLTETDVLSNLENFDISFYNTLKQIALSNDKEVEKETSKLTNSFIIKQLKDLSSLYDSVELLAVKMINSGMRTAMPFNNYISFIEDITNLNNNNLIALHLFSVILMSEEIMNKSALEIFTENSEFLFDDLNQIVKVNSAIVTLSNELNTLQHNNKITSSN